MQPIGLGEKFAGRGTLAFTLIELLVVIAILTLLLSILMPSLQQARELAKNAICMANLRHMTIGLFTYAGDQGDFPVYTYDGMPARLNGNRNRYDGTSMWQKMLPDLARSGYLPSPAIGYCSQAGAIAFDDGRTQPANWPKGYVWRMDHDCGHWAANFSDALTNQGDYFYYGPGIVRYTYDHMAASAGSPLVEELQALTTTGTWPGHWGGVHYNGAIRMCYSNKPVTDVFLHECEDSGVPQGIRTPLLQDSFLSAGLSGGWWTLPYYGPHNMDSETMGVIYVAWTDGSVEPRPFR